MKWTQQQLFKINSFPHHFDETFDFSDQLTADGGILSIGITHVFGYLNRVTFDKYELVAKVSVLLVVECALTLEPTDYQLDFELVDLFSFIEDSSDDVVVIHNNVLDTSEIIWGNILLEKPIRIVKPDAYEILEARGITLVESTEDVEKSIESPFLKNVK